MKRALFSIMILAAVSVITGCFTSATAYTKKTSADGVVTESKCSIVGTGDKVSQIAADGLFADGTTEDLGAGVKKASASQQSTGIDGTLNGLANVLVGIERLVAAKQGIAAAPAAASTTAQGNACAISASPAQSDSADSEAADLSVDSTANPEGYGGAPGANGEGVYGRPSCSRCKAYQTSHPDTPIINIDKSENKTAMWAAIRKRGFNASSVALPVSVTADSYVSPAK